MMRLWLRLFAGIIICVVVCMVLAQFIGRMRNGAMIAFTSDRNGDDHQIFVVDVDFGTVAQITHTDHTHSSPAWSADGQTLAWLQGGVLATFWALDTQNNQPYPLTQILISAPQLAWSPTNDTFLFEKTASNGWKNIILMNTLNGEMTNLTENNQLHETSPAWSPDGDAFVYNFRDNVGNERIAIYNFVTDETQIISDEQSVYPSWSPDGKMIAYLTTRSTSSKITFTDLTTHQTWDYFSSFPVDYLPVQWSPDSQKVAFGLNSGQIKILNVVTGETQDITPRNTYDISPAWSPDGQFLVVVENTNRRRTTKLVLVNVNTGERRQLTFETTFGFDRMPVWRP